MTSTGDKTVKPVAPPVTVSSPWASEQRFILHYEEMSVFFFYSAQVWGSEDKEGGAVSAGWSQTR